MIINIHEREINNNSIIRAWDTIKISIEFTLLMNFKTELCVLLLKEYINIILPFSQKLSKLILINMKL